MDYNCTVVSICIPWQLWECWTPEGRFLVPLLHGHSGTHAQTVLHTRVRRADTGLLPWGWPHDDFFGEVFICCNGQWMDCWVPTFFIINSNPSLCHYRIQFSWRSYVVVQKASPFPFSVIFFRTMAFGFCCKFYWYSHAISVWWSFTGFTKANHNNL